MLRDRERLEHIKSHKTLVLNWDQSGVRLMSSSNWTMEEQGSRRVAIEGLNDKIQITATLTVTLSREFLPCTQEKQIDVTLLTIFLAHLTSFIHPITGPLKTQQFVLWRM